MIYLIPAYGKKYASNEAMLEAWNDGADFRVYTRELDGPYTSVRDRVHLIENHDEILLCQVFPLFYVKVTE